MRRPRLTWAGLALLALIAFGCAGKVPEPAPESPTPTPPRQVPPSDTVKNVVTNPVPVSPTPPVMTPDSTGPEPRPSVIVENNNLKSVRTRLIPRVMGRGWALSVNKSDSIEFIRNADPAMTAFLFHSQPVPAARIRLRFRLQQVKEGVKIVSTAHLVGNAVYPYRPVTKVLEDNLAELRDDLLSAPSTMDPIIDRVPPKKK